ncbi:MAG: type I DNA topoisomerase [Bacilli bacterium]
MKNLVIVESPSKCKTIEKYLGSSYSVTSSKGHIRDLATTGKYGFGVDIENNFKPNYKVITGKSVLVKDLKKLVKEASHVFLATDPDREGEAISWHLKDALDIEDNKCSRVVFNEITQNAIKKAFSNLQVIDENLVHSQESRRIIDRIIGFRLSKLMQNKTEGKSAGRVQSVALKLIVDREREINAFNPKEYWTIEASFSEFDALLVKYMNKKIEINNEEEANHILSLLSNAFNIETIDSKEKKKSSRLPFTTSTLTQMASNRLGFSASKTMKIAQKLYEGINTDEGLLGLISYMRTDSYRLSDEFVSATKEFISHSYGPQYVGYAKNPKSKNNIQDAHEAIRPTNINKTPERLKKYLTADEYKIYNLIYVRCLSSLMSDAKVLSTSVILDNNNYKFSATGQVLLFDGYLKVYSLYEQQEDKILPNFSEYRSKVLVCKKINKEQHFTSAPPRFTEGSLIKELEKLGIGRPSTYAKIIDILKFRKYIEIEAKKFLPTEVGVSITDKLQEFFSSIINVEYTANMENSLDEVAQGNKVWYELLKEFYKDFEPLVDKAFNNMEKIEAEKTGEVCPNCGKDLVVKFGKFGKFVACSGFPDCKYIKKEERPIVEICNCPTCDGKIIEKITRKGKIFYGCSSYPKCSNAYWDKPTGNICNQCKGLLVLKNDKEMCPVCDKKETIKDKTKTKSRKYTTKKTTKKITKKTTK